VGGGFPCVLTGGGGGGGGGRDFLEEHPQDSPTRLQGVKM